jgi:hypothetical protein
VLSVSSLNQRSLNEGVNMIEKECLSDCKTENRDS